MSDSVLVVSQNKLCPLSPIRGSALWIPLGALPQTMAFYEGPCPPLEFRLPPLFMFKLCFNDFFNA